MKPRRYVSPAPVGRCCPPHRLRSCWEKPAWFNVGVISRFPTGPTVDTPAALCFSRHMDAGLVWLLVGSAAVAIFIVAIFVKRRSTLAKRRLRSNPVRGAVGHCINEKTLEDQVRVHLAECLDPPVDQALAELCCQTITLATSGGWEKTVPLPAGMTFRGMSEAPVHSLVGEFQLTGWLYGSLSAKPGPS